MTSVEPLGDARLRVTFVDGTTGEVGLRAFLDSAATRGTVFEALRDPEASRQACAETGTVVWPRGADLAPDAMYDAIRAHGRWLVRGSGDARVPSRTAVPAFPAVDGLTPPSRRSRARWCR